MNEVLKSIRAAIIAQKGEDLTGWCELAACLVAIKLDALIVKGTVNGKGHFWNEKDGVLIDLTADQFGLEYGIVPERNCPSYIEAARWSSEEYDAPDCVYDYLDYLEKEG